MKAFVEGWITMSGPSSCKAGMQGACRAAAAADARLTPFLPLRAGNSDSSNGCNCIYDEMIDELTDGDGSNRTESVVASEQRTWLFASECEPLRACRYWKWAAGVRTRRHTCAG